MSELATVDPVALRVNVILNRAAAHAYQFPRPHDEGDACGKCGGDGCRLCRYTGEPTA